MKIIFILILLLPAIGLGKPINCDFEFKSGHGKLKLTVKENRARVRLNYQRGIYTYKNCNANKDEFGLLIDCNTGNLDFMVLLSDSIKSLTGGIMSSTHNLFVDIDC